MREESFISKSRIDLLFHNLPQAIASNLVISSVLFFVFRNKEAFGRVLLFMAFLWTVNLLRLMLYFLVKNDKIDKYSALAGFLFAGGLIGSSGLWGAMCFLLIPGLDSVTGLFLSIVLVGFATGGMITLTARTLFAMIHLHGIMIPLIAATYLHRHPYYLELLVVLVFYDFFLMVLVSSLSRQISQNLSLKYKNLVNQETIRLNEQRYKAIFVEAPVGILYYDTKLVIQNCNESLFTILKTDADHLLGLDMHTIRDKRVLPAIKCILNNKKGHYEGPYHSTNSDIEIICTLKTSPVTNNNGEVIGGVCILEDNTEREGILNKMEYQAYHDALTGLPNRLLLLDRLEQALIATTRNESMGAVLFLDLDKFKLVNDTMGHRIGDLLLQGVAHRIRKALREEDTVARLGGDEFVILLPKLAGSTDEIVHKANGVAQKIHDSLVSPFLIEIYSIQASTSIGVYLFSKDDQSAEHILKSADTAMYNAKETGRKKTSFYHSRMEDTMMQQLILEQELEQALRKGELEIYYQPIVALSDRRIVGAEALLRWKHKERGFIPPEDIIETAESSGLILPLGEWILQQVLSDFSQWLESGFHLNYISVNISIKQLLQAEFVENLMQIVNKSTVPREKILLEITESILISDFENTIMKIRSLQNFGLQFALDDFGTGYSSLSYLKRLPVNKLKIDRLFTGNLLSDQDDFVMIQTILSIADHFHLDVIAEGVEDIHQVEKLRAMGCRFCQGYYFGRPCPAGEFFRLSELSV